MKTPWKDPGFCTTAFHGNALGKDHPGQLEVQNIGVQRKQQRTSSNTWKLCLDTSQIPWELGLFAALQIFHFPIFENGDYIFFLPSHQEHHLAATIFQMLWVVD